MLWIRGLQIPWFDRSNLFYDGFQICRDGIDEGVAKGEAKGFAKGEAKGFAKGEARGSYHKSLDIAKKMLLKGMDDDSIMELTGLTHEQLHQLKS